ncbi:uncharacterized protein CC84DRAFT_1218457 [Paraphaeosphaeria sporulosa]|uniref:Uncharacterized protein n=1 Tax=Paraphaeosphaeria sporulosa TaxID=1460663 RepID=A0A177CD10_9PLEO|nr:uncharacterized protein CC84DRAFT_1218457 [Paraphaeosphaeria sporulosa]OAG05071.1 hypothetical protein CC84DRAFT_1218457 [Paraphaeosphaeria sporulosa]
MSVLAFKALDYGADKLPDRIFEAIPGGFFTPDHKRHPKSKTKRRPLLDSRGKSEQRNDRGRRRSQRERTPPSEHLGYSSYDDSDYERDQRRQGRRRRVKSLGRSPSRSLSRSSSRGRHHHQRSSGFDGEGDERAQMDRERADRGPQFPPPPTSEYRQYNPQGYASPPPPATGGQYDPYRPAQSARQDQGYPPQVNTTTSRSRSATLPAGRPAPTPLQILRSKLMSRSPSNMSTPLLPVSPLHTPPTMESLRIGTPLGASFLPSYEPPLAALLSRPATNSPQPTSHTAARYTPGAGYAPSPVNVNSPIPPPPNNGYAPYNPADYASSNAGYPTAGNTYPSPPPFYRQSSRSQPSLAQYPYPDSQVAAYDSPPDRHGSSSSSRRHRHQDDRRHRARSAGQHGRSRSRVTDKFRDRFESMDLHDKNLAASVGGAGIGAFGGRELEKRHDK